MKSNILIIVFLAFTLCLSACQKDFFKVQKKTKIIYAGQPSSVDYPNKLKVLYNKGFIVAYDEKRLNPAWVAYKLFEVSEETKSPKRPSHFEPDPRLEVQVNHKDYTHSGYDRGHMAPNYAIATRYGIEGQLQTFYTSNIVPQKHSLNGGIWERLEKKIANDYANNFSEVWVITGPIYDSKQSKRYLKKAKIQIPDAFYMIVLDELYGQPRALAFIVPQTVDEDEKNMNKFLTSIDQIEKISGFDFFAELEDQLENSLEAIKEKQVW